MGVKVEAIIHIAENTPPNCKVPLFDIVFNGDKIGECVSWDELKEWSIGEVIDAWVDGYGC